MPGVGACRARLLLSSANSSSPGARRLRRPARRLHARGVSLQRLSLRGGRGGPRSRPPPADLRSQLDSRPLAVCPEPRRALPGGTRGYAATSQAELASFPLFTREASLGPRREPQRGAPGAGESRCSRPPRQRSRPASRSRPREAPPPLGPAGGAAREFREAEVPLLALLSRLRALSYENVTQYLINLYRYYVSIKIFWRSHNNSRKQA